MVTFQDNPHKTFNNTIIYLIGYVIGYFDRVRNDISSSTAGLPQSLYRIARIILL